VPKLHFFGSRSARWITTLQSGFWHLTALAWESGWIRGRESFPHLGQVWNPSILISVESFGIGLASRPGVEFWMRLI
jgi:hypothetical protein